MACPAGMSCTVCTGLWLFHEHELDLNSGQHGEGSQAEGHEVGHAQLSQQASSPSMHSRQRLHHQLAGCQDALQHQHPCLLIRQLQLVGAAEGTK